MSLFPCTVSDYFPLNIYSYRAFCFPNGSPEMCRGIEETCEGAEISRDISRDI